MQKTCPLCDVAFTCESNQPGCWCEEISLSRERLALIALAAAGCLCHGCLAATAGNSPMERPSTHFEERTISGAHSW